MSRPSVDHPLPEKLARLLASASPDAANEALADALTALHLGLESLARGRGLAGRERLAVARCLGRLKQVEAMLPLTGAPPYVLVAEDQPALRREVVDALCSAGQLVRTAHDGASALALAVLQVPSLLVTNLQLPELTGKGLIALLRARRRYADMPILIVSVGPRAVLKAVGRASGSHAYSRARLVAMVHALRGDVAAAVAELPAPDAWSITERH